MGYTAPKFRCTIDGGIPVCRPAKLETIAIEAVGALKTNKRVYVRPLKMEPYSVQLELTRDAPPKATNSVGDPMPPEQWVPHFLAITGMFHRWIEVPLPDMGSIHVNPGAGDGIT